MRGRNYQSLAIILVHIGIVLIGCCPKIKASGVRFQMSASPLAAQAA